MRSRPVGIHPEYNAAWVDAKKQSPSRAPYSDAGLVDLRIFYSPTNLGYAADHQEAAVIWTLLDMLEEQRGWEP